MRDVEVGSTSNIRDKWTLMKEYEQHVTTLASIAKPDNYVYPREKIDESWEKVLLNQCMCHYFILLHTNDNTFCN
jgi:translation initiation factor 2 alpha subunit (eIF-2alpha)